MIHPSAIVSPQARLDSTVEVGPHAVIDAGVSLGSGCVVGPGVYLTGQTAIGAGNRFHAGCVIGDAPQDLKYKGAPTRLVIGDRNVFREGVSVHRSTREEDATVIGSDNFLMVHTHVGHNCVIGSHVVIANATLLAGHVQVGDRVFISGNCLIHQFTRIGTLALMQGGAGIGMDLPPFTIAIGINSICGLNIIGLRRAGISPADRLELKKLYRHLFLSNRNLTEAAAEARPMFNSPSARTMLDFLAASKRGVCRHNEGHAERASAETDDAID